MAIDLDKIIGANTPVEPVETDTEPAESVETEDQGEVGEEENSGETEGQGEEVESESSGESEDQGEEAESESSGESEDHSAEPEELDLDEYTVEVDGEERTINQVLDERDRLAAIVQEIESDDFLKRFVQHYKATGDATAFLKSQTVDYGKMNDLDVLRQNFDKENSDLDQETRDLLFSEELRNKYKFDPDNQDDFDTDSKLYKIGQGLIKRDAEKARSKFVEEQKQFAIPEPAKQAVSYDPEAYKQRITSNEDVAKFLDKKLLKLEVLGENNTPLGYEVDNPAEVVEMMTNDAKFWGIFQKPDGSIDHARQAKVYAYAKDPATFEKQLVELGKTLAVEANLREKRNTDGVLSKAKTGGQVSTTGDWKSEFLKAARQQKKS